MPSYKIFISYPREDWQHVKRLATALEEAGHTIWIDIESIKGGQKWARKINEALDECERVVAVQSEGSIQRSYHCKGEWQHARDKHIPLIPVCFDNDLKCHDSFADVQTLHFFDDFDAALKQLLEALELPSVLEDGPKYVLSNSGLATTFPNFFNQDKAKYESILKGARHIRYSGTSGFIFLDQHHYEDFVESLKAGAKLDVMLAKPHNYANMARWSAWTETDDDLPDVEDRIFESLRTTLKSLKWLERKVNDAIELRIMEHFGPVPLILIDPDEEQGVAVFGIYAYGSTIHENGATRPGSKVPKALFPDLFHHFRIMYENMWKRATPYTVEDYSQEVLGE